MLNCLSLYNVELFETLNILVFLGSRVGQSDQFSLKRGQCSIVLVKLLIAYFLLRKGRCYVYGCFYHI